MSTTVQGGPAAVLGFKPPEGCKAYAQVSIFAETEAIYEQWRDRLAEVGHRPGEHFWRAPDNGERLRALQWSEGSVYCSIHGPRETRT